MTTVSIEEAEAKLSELIHQLKPGDEVVITENNQPIARLVPVAGPQARHNQPIARLVPVAGPQARRKLGTLKGTVTSLAPDFDEPLDEFREYMQ